MRIHRCLGCRFPGRGERNAIRCGAPRAVRFAGLVMVVTLSVSACSFGSGAEEEADPGSGSGSSEQVTSGVDTASPNVRVTRVSGSLDARRRSRLSDDVAALLARFVQSVLVTGDVSALMPLITHGARRQLRPQLQRLVSQASGHDGLERDKVSSTGYVSVLAPNGKPVGATVSIHAEVRATAGENAGLRKIDGRLLLSPAPNGEMRIFGVDLRRTR